jgi:hypothetical protein
LLLLAFLCGPARCRAEDWVIIRSGPFEVATNQDRKQARMVMNHLEQFRHVFGQTLNSGELKTLWPVRIVAGKITTDLTLGEDAYSATIAKNDAVPAQWNEALARAFLQESAARMPEAIERGLVAYFSTLQVDGIKVTGGAPPAKPDMDWARIHLLMTSEEYYGRIRSLLFNLQQGVAREAAFRNSLQKPEPVIEQEVAAWLAKGQFTTVRLNAKPIQLERDFYLRAWDPAKAAPAGAMAAFDKGDFARALQLKPDWPAAKFRLALTKTNAEEKLRLLKEAAEGARREASYWKAVAETQMAASQFVEAGKAWGLAERAAANDGERAAIRQARSEVEERRVAFELAEKQRKKEEAEAELNRIKNDALGEIRRAEAKANQKLAEQSGYDPNKTKPVPWWEDPKADPKKPAPGAKAPAEGVVKGVLERVDCVGLKKTLAVRTKEKALVMIAVRAGEVGYICGAQPKAREVTVKWVVLKAPQRGILGEAADVEFAPDPE